MKRKLIIWLLGTFGVVYDWQTDGPKLNRFGRWLLNRWILPEVAISETIK